MLRRENIDVVEMIDETRQAIVEMRSDKGFQQALVDARDLFNSIETEAEFQEPEARPLKKSSNMIMKFQMKLLQRDVTINSLQERLELNATYEKLVFI
ncbi:hypothetical protein AVEN_230842-1 [Araneus ventricosus]|uniref:Uncharacterized protein n=1 Tax=Araneus ventricosus TaxID=182803 RepID=A0A4Y2A2X5_ARAVE|nr:hypothetical protein AVEN_230842-1 [Araneus ventricosus]